MRSMLLLVMAMLVAACAGSAFSEGEALEVSAAGAGGSSGTADYSCLRFSCEPDPGGTGGAAGQAQGGSGGVLPVGGAGNAGSLPGGGSGNAGAAGQTGEGVGGKASGGGLAAAGVGGSSPAGASGSGGQGAAGGPAAGAGDGGAGGELAGGGPLGGQGGQAGTLAGGSSAGGGGGQGGEAGKPEGGSAGTGGAAGQMGGGAAGSSGGGKAGAAGDGEAGKAGAGGACEPVAPFTLKLQGVLTSGGCPDTNNSLGLWLSFDDALRLRFDGKGFAGLDGFVPGGGAGGFTCDPPTVGCGVCPAAGLSGCHLKQTCLFHPTGPGPSGSSIKEVEVQITLDFGIASAAGTIFKSVDGLSSGGGFWGCNIGFSVTTP